MKKNKYLIISCIICLLPMVLGIYYYFKLPDTLTTHWGMDNDPNGYMSKNIVVFGIPIIMMMFEILTVYLNDKKYNNMKPKIKLIYMSIIPVITVSLYIVTIFYNLGSNIDIREIVCFILGLLILVVGNYIPKGRLENNNFVKKNSFIKDEDMWNKIKKPYGYIMVLIGLLLIISIFFDEIISIILIILLILLPISMLIYGKIISK